MATAQIRTYKLLYVPCVMGGGGGKQPTTTHTRAGGLPSQSLTSHHNYTFYPRTIPKEKHCHFKTLPLSYLYNYIHTVIDSIVHIRMYCTYVQPWSSTAKIHCPSLFHSYKAPIHPPTCFIRPHTHTYLLLQHSLLVSLQLLSSHQQGLCVVHLTLIARHLHLHHHARMGVGGRENTELVSVTCKTHTQQPSLSLVH